MLPRSTTVPHWLFVAAAVVAIDAVDWLAHLGNHRINRWTYGQAGALFISPAYHRIHHSATGRLDTNLGTVLTIWDVASRRAVFPARGGEAAPTGLAGRPVPIEQSAAWPRLARIFLTQWAEPFTTSEVSDQ